VMLPNVLEFPVAYYGVLRAGGIVVPMNVLLKRREIAFYLEDSGAELLLAWHGFTEEAREGAADAGAEMLEVEPESFAALLAEREPSPGLADTAEDGTAVILYTSGTTGKPKGAELTHANLARNADVSSRTTCEIAAGDVVFGGLPLFHSYGQSVAMNASLRVGACLTLVPKFDPGEALATIQRDGVTHFYGVPTMFGALLHHPGRESFDTSALRTCITGGASMPVEVLRGFEDAFGAIVLEGYGLSETSPVSSSNHPDRERKPGSIGTPIEGVEMKLVDENDAEVGQGEVGEIVIRGHNIMKGYWQRPDATEEAMRGGWFHSGDMARTDEDGYFFIVDRKKDLIIRGGYNVYPREVEEVLYEHPKIRDAAVVGVPHDEWGEEIGAAVVLHEGEDLSPEEVSAYV
jgi:long-chain acyl-CoA synthetase